MLSVLLVYNNYLVTSLEEYSTTGNSIEIVVTSRTSNEIVVVALSVVASRTAYSIVSVNSLIALSEYEREGEMVLCPPVIVQYSSPNEVSRHPGVAIVFL